MKEPTPRQRKLAQNLIEEQLKDHPGTLAKVLEKTGYPQSTIRGTPGEIVQQKGVQMALEQEIRSMGEALAKVGVTPERVATKIRRLLNAKIKVRTFIKGTMTTEVEKEDSFAIDKGITHALKLGVGGGYQQVPVGPITINFFGNPKLMEMKDTFEEQIKATLSLQIESPPEV